MIGMCLYELIREADILCFVWNQNGEACIKMDIGLVGSSL